MPGPGIFGGVEAQKFDARKLRLSGKLRDGRRQGGAQVAAVGRELGQHFQVLVREAAQAGIIRVENRYTNGLKSLIGRTDFRSNHSFTMTLYRLPLTADERQTLEGWQRKYKSHSPKPQRIQILGNSKFVMVSIFSKKHGDEMSGLSRGEDHKKRAYPGWKAKLLVQGLSAVICGRGYGLVRERGGQRAY